MLLFRLCVRGAYASNLGCFEQAAPPLISSQCLTRYLQSFYTLFSHRPVGLAGSTSAVYYVRNTLVHE